MNNMLISEKEIVSKWTNDNVVVSVCMLAYNHEEYVADALNGILLQDVNFRYEILIHDDASTDSTADIIRTYQARYPNIVKPIFQVENKWSKGINPSVFYNYPRVLGDYVAWCEGDDVWSDGKKLKTQVDILREKSEIDICFHLSDLQNCITGNQERYSIGHYRDDSGYVCFDDIFLRRYGMIPTASCVVRKTVAAELGLFMSQRPYLTSGDVHMQTLGALRGGGWFINEVMSLYRFGTKSSLTKGILDSGKKNVNHHVSCIRGAISLWKNYFPERSEKTLKKIIYKRLVWLFLSDGSGRAWVEELGIQFLYSIYLEIEAYMRSFGKRLQGKDMVIYGCGHEAAKIVKEVGADNIKFIIDRDENKIEGYFDGVPFKPFSEIELTSDCFLIVSTMFYDEEKFLQNANRFNVKKENLIRIEDEILDFIDINNIWKGEVLMDTAEVMRLGQRVPGWWV